ncbi:MAG: BON domain-containing protein [Rhodanobacteraceae bacterium]
MRQLLTALGAAALGAGAMYYFDPHRGRRRRVVAQDKMLSATHGMREYARGQAKHALDQGRGAIANLRSRLRNDSPSDDQLNERIRARLGHLIAHPHAVHTSVADGRVTLRGTVQPEDLNKLMSALWLMRGVRDIDSRLEIDDGTTTEHESSLQGVA